MSISLPNLPYDRGDLEPHISSKTLDFHYGKHHNAYVTNLNKMIEGTQFAGKSLEEIMKATANDSSKAGVFNNSAQVWNHTFYWSCMKKNGGGNPSGTLASRINKDFGSLDDFVTNFKQAAATQFGSGWAWLVEDGGTLKIVKTSNADSPIVHGQKALLTIDVWEHAYYLDYQNRRPDYIATFVEKLVNWDFVASNL